MAKYQDAVYSFTFGIEKEDGTQKRHPEAGFISQVYTYDQLQSLKDYIGDGPFAVLTDSASAYSVFTARFWEAIWEAAGYSDISSIYIVHHDPDGDVEHLKQRLQSIPDDMPIVRFNVRLENDFQNIAHAALMSGKRLMQFIALDEDQSMPEFVLEMLREQEESISSK